MAHNLEFNEQKGTHSFFSSTEEKAWHGLGQNVNGAQTSEAAIKLANLDFEVIKNPCKIELPNGEIFTSDEKFATIRTDNCNVLGYVGKDYTIVQNSKAFDFFDDIVGEKEAIFETAGVLGRGERIFITAKLPNYIRVGKSDDGLIEMYLFLTNSHDGSGCVTAAFTPIRIVCNNTLNAALKNKHNSISIKHTASINDRLNKAHQLMGIVNLYKKEISDIFNHMAKKKVTDEDYLDIILRTACDNDQHKVKEYYTGDTSTKFNNLINDMMQYAFSHSTQRDKTTLNTAFGIYNAVTGFYQNEKEWSDLSVKTAQIIDGRIQKKQQITFDLVNKLTFN